MQHCQLALMPAECIVQGCTIPISSSVKIIKNKYVLMMDALILQLHLYASHLCKDIFNFPDDVLVTQVCIFLVYHATYIAQLLAKDQRE
jgi:hypothetical protein